MKHKRQTLTTVFLIDSIAENAQPSQREPARIAGSARNHRRYDEKQLPPVKNRPSDRRSRLPGRPLGRNKPEKRFHASRCPAAG